MNMGISSPLEQQQWIVNQINENFFDGRIRVNGDDMNFRCPFCGDSRKNRLKARGHYSKSRNVYHCFNCGHSCSGFDLVAQLRNCDVRQIKKEYFKYSTKTLDKSFKEAVEDTSRHIISANDSSAHQDDPTHHLDIKASWTELNKDCLDYLNSRYIFNAPGFDKANTLYYDTLSDRIVIPWRDNGEIIYYQSRAIRCYQSPKYLFPKGLPKQIYGLDQIDPLIPYVAFTEGVLDSIWIKNCVAIGGLYPTTEQIRHINERAIGAELIWFSDNFWIDESSKKEILRLAMIHPKMKVFNWPKNCQYKDVNEFVVKEKNFKQFWSADYILSNSISLAQAKLIIGFAS